MPLSDLFKECGEDADDSDVGMTGRKNGREVEVPPLCAVCCLGMEGEDVMQKSLGRVEKVDGGLSRVRWDIAQGMSSNLKRAPAVSLPVALQASH